MAQGFSFKASKASFSGSKGGAPKPGAKVIKPKKIAAKASAKIQKKIQGEYVKRTESMLIQKTRGMGESQFRVLRPDPKVLTQMRAAQAKKAQKAEEAKTRPVKMAPKKH